jgi:hypothetical protein
MAELIELTDISDVIEDIGQELREQIQRIGGQIIRDEQGYFEQVRQRMPALTGNAVSAVHFLVNESPKRIEIITRQEDIGVSGDGIAGYMPQGILTTSPHTGDHSSLEKSVAIKKVGRVVVNPSAAQDPWLQASLDLGHTNFQREGLHPTRISSDPPNLDDL